ncbi:hypothetical protein [Streptomyces sp. NPDC058683]|uniref:hypothetical protein n=1 Tax=Streptomyces sp. NPDC058683 TaxID=3346597 RepID=UPI003647A765
MAGLAAGAGLLVQGYAARIPWWIIWPFTALCAGFAAWAGARTGRENRIRKETPEPGEALLSTYTVKPPFTPARRPTPYENAPYQLRLTTRNLQLWEQADLLWTYPWNGLRLLVDGPRLRIFHQGREAGLLQLEHPGAVQEVLRAARRLGAG